jgi:DNA-nicking Smr family endonuclease
VNLNNLIFIDNLPKLDLHGYDRDSARVAVNDFVNDNIKMKNEFIVIVHGIGSGILRQATHDCLKHNRNVLEFKTYYYNNGCTIAKVKI